jgi:hypothetical protein
MIKIFTFILLLLIPNLLFGQSIKNNSYMNMDVDGNSFLSSDFSYYTKLNQKSTISLNQRITKINETWFYFGPGVSYNIKGNSTDFSTTVHYIDSKFFYDVLYRVTPTSTISVDLFSSRDFAGILIEDVPLNVFSNGLTSDIMVKNITLVGGVIWQDFSDFNHRMIYISNLIYSFPSSLIISLQNRVQHTELQRQTYFTPNSYSTHRLSIKRGFVLPNEKMSIEPEVIVGRQFINKNSDNLYGVAVKIRGTENKFGFDTKISYINSINEYSNYGIFIMTTKTNFNLK